MPVKFQTKSARVKGLAFHPRRSWLLAALHNGVVQLWDYEEKLLIDTYDEHKGPVRGIDFHCQQPLFVSGGDDSKLKLWNYKSRRCLFTIDAHSDYIRTCYFHASKPWIISASDDQTIGIWNWQSRSKIAILTGHSHYVMCARFHPVADLIMSCSADQTLRLWDISGLSNDPNNSSLCPNEEHVSGLPDLLSKVDYSVFSKEAHDGPISWCAFHSDPDKKLCFSGSDDKCLKVWRVDSHNELIELKVIDGHRLNISCVASIKLYDRQLIMSVSEDRTIKLWDEEKCREILCHRQDVDRIWFCLGHPRENLIAAGHDSGLLLIKVRKERPAFTLLKNCVLFERAHQVICHDLNDGNESVIAKLNVPKEFSQYFDRLQCYSYEPRQSNQIAISIKCPYNSDKSYVELYRLTKDGSVSSQKIPNARSAVFIGPNRLALLDHTNKINFRINDQERKSKSPIEAEEIFEASAGRLYIRHKVNGEKHLSLWDLERSNAIGSVRSDAKRVVISEDKKRIACIGKNIMIYDGQLRLLTTIKEQRPIKSAGWHQTGVLIYNTKAHLKYALTSGDVTIIKSLNRCIYIITIRHDKIYYIGRDRRIKVEHLDQNELRFKQAVISNDIGSIMKSFRDLKHISRPEISFLTKKGHPGLALRFVKDPLTKFSLALKAFDIDEALGLASKLNLPDCWRRLAESAMLIGHITAAEQAYKALEQPHQLAMLYLISNQRDKLLEARSMALELGDTSTEFILSLILKDFAQCALITKRCGHPNLAYMCALNHNLVELAENLRENNDISEDKSSRISNSDSGTRDAWMETSIPEIGNDESYDWPLLNNNEQDLFKDIQVEEILRSKEKSHNNQEHKADEDELDELGGDWSDDVRSSCDSVEFKDAPTKLDDEPEGDDGWGEEDEPLEDLLSDESDSNDQDDTKLGFVAPNPGQSNIQDWTYNSSLPLHHVLAGSTNSAIRLLENQIGLVNPEPLINTLFDLTLQSKVACKPNALFETDYHYPTSIDEYSNNSQPIGGYTLNHLNSRLTECYSLFSSGKFNEATDRFRQVLFACLFVKIDPNKVDSLDDDHADQEKQILNRIKHIIATCREYILSLHIWLERKSITGKTHEDNKRSCELASYFSKLNLPKHRAKVLEKALEVFLTKPREFQKTRAASAIASHLLDLLPTDDPKKEKMIAYAKKVKSAFEPEVDEQVQLAFDDLNPYQLCASTLTPIYSGHKLIACPLCDAKYKPEFSGSECKICLVSEIGKPAAGLKYIANSNNSKYGIE